jgi:hypothetical protein
MNLEIAVDNFEEFGNEENIENNIVDMSHDDEENESVIPRVIPIGNYMTPQRPCSTEIIAGRIENFQLPENCTLVIANSRNNKTVLRSYGLICQNNNMQYFFKSLMKSSRIYKS